jgi:thiol:disulfide interchange protein DsbG
MFVRKFVAALLVSAVTISVAFAASAAVPPVIKTLTKTGMTAVSSFPAASGLTGWVLKKDGQVSMVFVTADGKTLLAGALINEDGRNLTAEYGGKYLPSPDHSALYRDLTKATSISTGKAGGRDIYVLFDPNCPFCHLTWKALKPYAEAGANVHWVPVGYLKADSLKKAASILAAKNKAGALADMMDSQGKGAVGAKSDAASETQIALNNDLMRRHGLSGVPAMVYKDSSGKTVMREGLPRMSELPAITGLPEQKINDAELAAFR